MEGSAYFLEKYFCKKLGINNQDDITPSIPYKLAEAIGFYYNNSISETRTIGVMLTALQHVQPHKAYIELMRRGRLRLFSCLTKK